MVDALKNFAVSLVATAPSPATSGTSLAVTAATGSLFPAAPFYATCWPSGVQPTAANAEIVRVTAVATDTFTITRTQDGSTNQSIAVGWQIQQGVTAGLLSQYYQNATQVANVVVAVTQSANPAIDTDNGTIFEVFNLAQAITSLTTNLTGTPVDGQQICVAFSDNGTARAITYGAKFVNQGATAPTTTVVGDTTYTYWMYSSAATAWIFQYANVAASGGSSGLITQVNANTSGTFTAAIGDAINLTAAATITLPASPTIGNAVLITCANAEGFATTITANTGQSINGGTAGGSVTVGSEYNGTLAFQILFLAVSATDWQTVSSGTDLGGGLEVTGTMSAAAIVTNGSVSVGGGMSFHGAVTLTGATTTNNYTTWYRAISGTWTLTLGTQYTNQMVIITNEGTGLITVTPQSGTIDGVASRTMTGTTHPCGMTVITDQTNWHTIGSFGAVT